MPQNVIKNDIKMAIIHDEGEIGKQWKRFIEDLFTVDLPEECRELGLDVVTESMEKLDNSDLNDIFPSIWRLFLFSRMMLQALQDRSSPLYRSELFDSDTDKNIILILGGEDDSKFVEDAKHNLYDFPDYESFHIVQATSTEKIFNSIITIVSPLSIVFHPDILGANGVGQHVTLISNKAYPTCSEGRYLIEFEDSEETKSIEATLYNPYTLVLENPGHAPGIVKVSVYLAVGEEEILERKQLGEPISVWFQSEMDKVHTILEKHDNPFSFLCQAFNLKTSDSKANEAVDKVLTESFQKHIPADQLSRVFGNDQDIGNADSRRSEYAPTLLHFAALHGLRNLTALLLRCPGSVKAFGTANCDGDFPTNLAEKAGHWDLRDYMNSYMEVSAMVDYELGGSQQTSSMMSRIVTGQFYLSFSGAEAESYYESISSAKGGDNHPAGYLRMKPLIGDQELPSYDSPFIVPIPVAEETPNYESMLIQMIESEDTYMSFDPGDVFVDNSFSTYNPATDNVPPMPPPRDDPPYPPARSDHRLSVSTITPLKPPTPTKSKSGAERVSYEALNMPKLMSYISPAQQELISLQQKVKNNELTTNQAVLRFKEWERKHKEQAASFQFQQECLQRIRQSLMKSKEQKKLRGEKEDIEISGPITAGSSTYDLVLRKTHVGEAKETLYGDLPAPPPCADRADTPSSAASMDGRSSRSDSTSFQSRRFGNSFSRVSTKSFRSNSSLSVSSDSSPMAPTTPINNYTPRGDLATAIRRSMTGRPPPVPPRDGGGVPSDAPIVPPRSPFY